MEISHVSKNNPQSTSFGMTTGFIKPKGLIAISESRLADKMIQIKEASKDTWTHGLINQFNGDISVKVYNFKSPKNILKSLFQKFTKLDSEHPAQSLTAYIDKRFNTKTAKKPLISDEQVQKPSNTTMEFFKA